MISSYSAYKEKSSNQNKFSTTKTYTNNIEGNSVNSTNKSNEKLFPSIKSIGVKNKPASILERIH